MWSTGGPRWPQRNERLRTSRRASGEGHQMSAEQPVSVTRARQLLAVLVALRAGVTSLIVGLQDQLIKSWAEGRPDTRKVLRSQGLDAVKDGEVHVPAFIPVALVLFVV